MRLIDADALEFHRQLEPRGNGKYEYVDVIYKNDVDNAPTIEERKTGKWISHPGGKFVGFPYKHYECDQCRDFEPEVRNYCPNCGAKMGTSHE